MPPAVMGLLWFLLGTVICIFIALSILAIVWINWTAVFVPVYKRYRFNIEKATAEKELYSIEVKKAKIIEMTSELEEQFKELSLQAQKVKSEKQKVEKEMQDDKLLYAELKLKKQEKELAEQQKELEKEKKSKK
jgi:hypothetical protein